MYMKPIDESSPIMCVNCRLYHRELNGNEICQFWGSTKAQKPPCPKFRPRIAPKFVHKK